ncbi:Transcription cofactor vestigial-like protein 2 [Labeo rohita]|uniref:Transcription cofactor vestigial-like protein 2 n=1 Tax=Labeo rohita TaxID=84645 RepID=A0ABQ8LVE9_LABRO|nr:Transcription cofactor vestigial-like protein 2 [Labeo rohita]
MSCLDVMYPAYGHYAPYAHKASAFISTLPAPLGLRSPSSRCREPMDSVGAPCCSEGVPVSAGSSSSGGPSPSQYPSAGQVEEAAKDKEVGEAEYLSSRCVLFTYYQGDISSVVDEHFSRALSTYMEAEGKKRHSDPSTDGACLPTDTMFIRGGKRSGSSSYRVQAAHNTERQIYGELAHPSSDHDYITDASSSSSRRSFPPSFWDSNYPSPPSRPHCDPTGAPTYAMDPYAQALHPGLPHSHAHPHPSESWSYSQSQPYPPPRPLHELYSPPGLDAHYGPLLMPAVRPPHLPTLPGHYDVSSTTRKGRSSTGFNEKPFIDHPIKACSLAHSPTHSGSLHQLCTRSEHAPGLFVCTMEI